MNFKESGNCRLGPEGFHYEMRVVLLKKSIGRAQNNRKRLCKFAVLNLLCRQLVWIAEY